MDRSNDCEVKSPLWFLSNSKLVKEVNVIEYIRAGYLQCVISLGCHLCHYLFIKQLYMGLFGLFSENAAVKYETVGCYQ